MNISNKTVLVTGGGSGIGFETAKSLSEKGNKVIIVGRNEAKLQEAASKLNNVTAIACDISSASDVQELLLRIQNEFSDLSILINNAGAAYAYRLTAGVNAYDKAAEEMQVNYLSLIRLTETFLPLLSAQTEAAVVNVSSIVAYAPGAYVPTYSVSKVAVHAYTQILRHELAKDTNVKVFELFPPLVNTEFSKEIGGENGIPPSVVADDLVAALESDQYEIRVGATEQIYQLFLSSPEEAFKAINQAK